MDYAEIHHFIPDQSIHLCRGAECGANPDPINQLVLLANAFVQKIVSLSVSSVAVINHSSY